MRNFREAYKQSVDNIKLPDLTAEQIKEEGSRKKFLTYHRQRRFVAAASAACIFLLCTAGVAAAAGYAKSVIRTDAFGFRTADPETALENAAEAQPEEGILTGQAQEDVVEDAGTEKRAEFQSASSEECVMESADMEEIQEQRYDSLEAFQEAIQEGKAMPVALPDQTLLGNAVCSEEYLTLGNSFLLVRIETDGHLFMIDQSYYGDSEGHAASIVYPEGVCNERSYTTVQGFTYIVLDSVREEEGEPGIHAAISIGDYELIVDFLGYTEEEAYEILDNMDLTVYLENER